MARNTDGILGVSLPSSIQNATANLPIAYSQDIQGGLTSVASSTMRLQIPAQKLQEGMLVYQDDTNQYYMFLATTVISSTRTALARDADSGNFTNSGVTLPQVTPSDAWQEIQFDVDSITVNTGGVNPEPTAADLTATANPANPHEGDLYINHNDSTLWYYVIPTGQPGRWVSSAGITTGVGDSRYLQINGTAQTISGPNQDQARTNIGAGDINAEDVAITLNASNAPVVNTDTSAAAIRNVLDVHDTTRIVGERYALSNGNVEEWNERRVEGGASVVNRYRAAVNRVETSTLVTSSTASLDSDEVRITVDAGYQTLPPTTGRITLQYPNSDFINAVIAEGRRLGADNSTGTGVRIYGHTVGFPIGAVFEVALATGDTGTPGTSNTLVANLLCEINDTRRVTRRETTQTYTYEVLADSSTGVSFDILNPEGNEEYPTSIVSVVRGSDILNFTTTPGDADRVTVTDAVTDGDMLVVTYAVNEFSGFTPSVPSAINGQQALYAILDEVSEVLIPSITAFDGTKYYGTNELVTDGGIIYRKLTTNPPNGANPGGDAGNWQQESLILADIPYDPQTFTGNVDITATVDTNTFTFEYTGDTANAQARAARLSLLENIFGLTRTEAQVSIPSTAPVSFPGLVPQISVNTSPPTGIRATGLTISSAIPTGVNFAITIHGLIGPGNAPIAAASGRTVTFTRANDEVPVHEITTVTDGGIRMVAGGNILTLSADDTVVRQDELPNLENTTSSTISNLSTNPNFTPQFEVTADSIGQTQFDKANRAAVGAFMTVGADGQQISYVPSDSTRPSRFTRQGLVPDSDPASYEDLDIAVQRRYSRTSWDTHHAQFASRDSNSGTGNTAAFPLRMPTSNILSTEMVNELNALTQASDNTAFEYAFEETYGINPFERSTAVAGRPEILAQSFAEGGIDSLSGFQIDVDYGFILRLPENNTATDLRQVIVPSVRAVTDPAVHVVEFDEYIRRAHDLLRDGTSSLAGRWSISTDYTAPATTANVILTAEFNGPIHDNGNGAAFGFVPPTGTALHTEEPRRVGFIHEVQRGVASSGATNVPHSWTELTETTQTFTGDAATSTYTVDGDIVNQSFVIIELDNVRQTLGTDYTVNVVANSITFIDSGGNARNIANGVTIEVIYSTAIDLADGQYLLFRVTGIVGGGSTGRIANATWLNDGISTGNFTKVADTAYTVREFTDATVTEPNRILANVNAVSNTDTGIRQLPTRVPVPQADIDDFNEAEHDRYMLISGTPGTPSGVYAHLLDIQPDHIDVDMDHYLSVNADNTVVYRPNVTFRIEIGNDNAWYVLNFLGAGDVTREGNTPQTVNRVTNFTNLQIDGREQIYISPQTGASLRHPTPAINAFLINGSPTTDPERLRLDAYTRDESDDNDQRAIARIHSEGITHDVAPGLSINGTDNGIGIVNPTPSNHTFVLNRGFDVDIPADERGRTTDYDRITNLDNDILDSVEGEGPTQPFVKVEVPNHTQVTNFQFSQSFTVTQAQVDADANSFDFVLNDSSGAINSIVSVTRNGTPLVSTDFTTDMLPTVTVDTALDVGNSIVITYLSGAILNEGSVTQRALGSVVTVTNRPHPTESDTMQGLITASTARPTFGRLATLAVGDTIALNTDGNTFDGTTSLELRVEGFTNDRAQYIVRPLAQSEINRFNNTSAGVVWRDRSEPVLTSVNATSNTFTIQNVRINRTTLESDNTRLNSGQILRTGTTYVIELRDDTNQYFHAYARVGAGLFVNNFLDTLIILNAAITGSTDPSIRWYPRNPDLTNFTGATLNQQVYIYEAATGNPIDLYYHFTPRDTDSNRLNPDWNGGRYEVDLTTAYSVDNRVLTAAGLPVTQHAFPIVAQYELGYFSNRLTLQGLERFQPVRNASNGRYVLNLSQDNTNDSTDNPTIFYRGYFRSDLSTPVYMIRRVNTEHRELPDSEPVVQTRWAGWDGNAPENIGDTIDIFDAFPTGDRQPGEFFFLRTPVNQGQLTRGAGLYQRNQSNDGWLLLEFSDNLPNRSTLNE